MTDFGTRAERGSFRDPAGYVFTRSGDLYRALTSFGAERFAAVERTGLLARLQARGDLVGYEEAMPGSGERSPTPSPHGFAVERLLRLARLPTISFPYKWSFSALRAAALLHLDLHLEALNADVTLSDASAYNIQFRGARPVFIDQLSFVPYAPGTYWTGHDQFCRQFLAPLVLTAATGVPHQAWYRGALDGVDAAAVADLLPLSWRARPRVLTHLVLPARLARGARLAAGQARTPARPLPKQGLEWMLRGLHAMIAGLQPRATATTWADYADGSLHGDAARAAKEAFVREAVGDALPDMLLDLGCNAGHYTRLALAAGARSAVGVDMDPNALDAAFRRASAKQLPMLSLVMDLTNMSPAQGWAEAERPAFVDRVAPAMVMALAVTHHMTLGANIPLGDVVQRIGGLAPQAIIEFVPADDPMAVRLIGQRAALFADYTEARFRAILGDIGEIVRETRLPGAGRLLVHLRRRRA